MQTKLDGYVGFDTVLEQQRKKFLKKGFEFNLMVVGMCSLGPGGPVISHSARSACKL